MENQNQAELKERGREALTYNIIVYMKRDGRTAPPLKVHCSTVKSTTHGLEYGSRFHSYTHCGGSIFR